MTPLSLSSPPPAAPPALVYAARFYDPRPKIRTYSHLYKWRVGQTGRGTLLTTGANDDTDPQAAPDGKTVFFIRNHDKKPPQLCALSLQTKQVRILFFGVMPDDFLWNLQVSPSGRNLLIRHVVVTSKSFRYLYSQWLVIPTGKRHKTTMPHKIRLSKMNGSAGEAIKAAWASTEEVLLSHLNPGNMYGGGGVLQVVSLVAPNAPRTLPVEVGYYALEADLSPDRRFILNLPDDAKNKKAPFSSASLVRVADGKTIAKWPVAPNEGLHWLTSNRLVGIDHKASMDWTPLRFRFYSVQGTSSPSPTPFVSLQLNTNAVHAALQADYEDVDRLTRPDPLREDTSGAFLLGTPWHRGNKGVRFRINAKTGQATLWSRCFTPHPSPSGAYFWSQPGTDFAEVGKRPNGTRMTEAVWRLYVASYAEPARLIPVVSGAAYASGADWLPAKAPPQRKPKP